MNEITFCLSCGYAFFAGKIDYCLNCKDEKNLDFQKFEDTDENVQWLYNLLQVEKTTAAKKMWSERFHRNCAKSCKHCLLRRDCKLEKKK